MPPSTTSHDTFKIPEQSGFDEPAPEPEVDGSPEFSSLGQLTREALDAARRTERRTGIGERALHLVGPDEDGVGRGPGHPAKEGVDHTPDYTGIPNILGTGYRVIELRAKRLLNEPQKPPQAA